MESSRLSIPVSIKVMKSFPSASGFFHCGYRYQKFVRSRRTGEKLILALWRRLETQSLQLNSKCTMFFGARGWDADIKDNGNKLIAHAVAQLLCRQQFFCEVTELMVQNLQERLAAARTKHPHHVIASSCLYTIFDLERTKFHQKESLLKTLKRLVDQVEIDPQLILWLPMLHSNHQVVVQVDFGKRVISYGMWLA